MCLKSKNPLLISYMELYLDGSMFIYPFILYMYFFYKMDKYILNRLRERLLDRGSIRNMPEKTLQETFILNTWGTNAIEGNTLTLKEVTRIIETGKTVTNRRVKDVIETVQHISALAEVVNGNISEINMKSALELHNIRLPWNTFGCRPMEKS